MPGAKALSLFLTAMLLSGCAEDGVSSSGKSRRGAMALTAAGDWMAFVVFGACAPL